MKIEKKPKSSSVERHWLSYHCPKNPDALVSLMGCSGEFTAVVEQNGYPEIANIISDGGRVAPKV